MSSDRQERRMQPRLYPKTTIPSYVVARESGDAILRGQQAATRQWWEQRRINSFLNSWTSKPGAETRKCH